MGPSERWRIFCKQFFYFSLNFFHDRWLLFFSCSLLSFSSSLPLPLSSPPRSSSSSPEQGVLRRERGGKKAPPVHPPRGPLVPARGQEGVARPDRRQLLEARDAVDDEVGRGGVPVEGGGERGGRGRGEGGAPPPPEGRQQARGLPRSPDGSFFFVLGLVGRGLDSVVPARCILLLLQLAEDCCRSAVRNSSRRSRSSRNGRRL